LVREANEPQVAVLAAKEELKLVVER